MNFIESQTMAWIAAVILGALGSYLATVASKVLPNRRLWQFSEPKEVVICVATSSHTDTSDGIEDGYIRAATGVGQVRALGLIMPSLALAYKGLEIRNIRLSADMPGDELKHDLICLGGAKNNEVTARLLVKLAENVPVRQEKSSTFYWTDRAGNETSYLGQTEAKEVRGDFGYVIHTENPWCRGRTVVVLAGTHTFGTVAAAEYFVNEMSRLRNWRKADFAALVSVDVNDGYPAEPVEVDYIPLDDWRKRQRIRADQGVAAPSQER